MNGGFNVQTMEARILRSNVHVLSRKSALPQCSPDLFLIAVHLGGICPSCRIVPISQSVSQSAARSYKRTNVTESHGERLVDLVY